MAAKSRWRVTLMASLVALGLIGTAFTSRALAGDKDLKRGEKIFKLMCIKCHGKEGKGDGPKASKLEKKPADYTQPGFFEKNTDDKLKKMILEGNLPMPSFELKLNEDDVENVIAYIKTLAAEANK